MKQKRTIIIGTVFTVIILTVTFALFNNNFFIPNGKPHEPSEQEIVYYTYQIVNTYPHNNSAFTQGLVYEDDILYEGTGLYGQSTIRKVNLETGNVTQIHTLPAHFFGEGITIFENNIIQITWKNNIGFVYNKDTFELVQQFNYSTDGWGLTHNNSALIMSVGNATLFFLDPETFQIINEILVSDDKGPVINLNELEYINGSIYANIWFEDTIAIINPKSGNVTGWIDLTGLKDLVKSTTSENVLNGIAYDKNRNRLFVTGKNWSKLFEIKLVAEN